LGLALGRNGRFAKKFRKRARDEGLFWNEWNVLQPDPEETILRTVRFKGSTRETIRFQGTTWNCKHDDNSSEFAELDPFNTNGETDANYKNGQHNHHLKVDLLKRHIELIAKYLGRNAIVCFYDDRFDIINNLREKLISNGWLRNNYPGITLKIFHSGVYWLSELEKSEKTYPDLSSHDGFQKSVRIEDPDEDGDYVCNPAQKAFRNGDDSQDLNVGDNVWCECTDLIAKIATLKDTLEVQVDHCNSNTGCKAKYVEKILLKAQEHSADKYPCLCLPNGLTWWCNSTQCKNWAEPNADLLARFTKMFGEDRYSEREDWEGKPVKFRNTFYAAKPEDELSCHKRYRY